MSDDKKVIFLMSGVKTFPCSVTGFKNIYLSFLWSKNWDSGLNGSGKSTLLKIIAGIDKSFQGDVVFSLVTVWAISNKNPKWTMRKRS